MKGKDLRPLVILATSVGAVFVECGWMAWIMPLNLGLPASLLQNLYVAAIMFGVASLASVVLVGVRSARAPGMGYAQLLLETAALATLTVAVACLIRVPWQGVILAIRPGARPVTLEPVLVAIALFPGLRRVALSAGTAKRTLVRDLALSLGGAAVVLVWYSLRLHGYG